jgi:hypothetical protein
MLNRNLGVLTFGAVIVTAVAVYLSARLKQAEDRYSQARRRGDASRRMRDEVDKMVHNLQHFCKLRKRCVATRCLPLGRTALPGSNGG